MGSLMKIKGLFIFIWLIICLIIMYYNTLSIFKSEANLKYYRIVGIDFVIAMMFILGASSIYNFQSK